MNALTASSDIDPAVLQATADAFDANFAHGSKLENDAQIRRSATRANGVPTSCAPAKPAPLQTKGAGPSSPSRCS
jgi:hypothetical protein